MQIPGGLDKILGKIGNNVKSNFEKIKGKIGGFSEYLDEGLREIRDKTYYGLRKIKDGISEYGPIVVRAAFAPLPYYAKGLFLAGLHIKNTYKGLPGKVLGYGLIGLGAAVGLGIMFGLNAIHSLPSSNHVQYLGSPDGYEAFVPNGQTINYNGHTDPVGDLILYNGHTIQTIQNAVWDGQYANTIIQNHNQIVQLNNQLNGNMQDLYVIKGPVPIEQVTINGQTYNVVEANNINPQDIAGFYTDDKLVSDAVAAMNTPGTYAARLPGNSPVFQWTNTTGRVAYKTLEYDELGAGGYILVLPNKTIIPYGILNSPSGSALANFDSPQQVYNLPS